MDKELVEQFSPEVYTGVPSVLFCVEKLEDAHRQLVQKTVESTDIVEMNGMRTFSFCDLDGNILHVNEAAAGAGSDVTAQMA